MREEFEAWAKAPPFEFNIDRFNDIEAWPGAYRNYSTHCAWDAWQAAYQAGALAMRERAAKACETLSWSDEIDWWMLATKKDVSIRDAFECSKAIRSLPVEE